MSDGVALAGVRLAIEWGRYAVVARLLERPKGRERAPGESADQDRDNDGDRCRHSQESSGGLRRQTRHPGQQIDAMDIFVDHNEQHVAQDEDQQSVSKAGVQDMDPCGR